MVGRKKYNQAPGTLIDKGCIVTADFSFGQTKIEMLY